MNKELKRVSTVVLLMFLALFCSSTVIQVFATDSLRSDSRNVRTLYDSYSVERGPILVAGKPIAESKPVADAYKFQRVYSDPKLYAAVTGYLTLNQENPGIEGELSAYLSGTANDQFLGRLTSIVTGQTPKGAAVQLTLDPSVQKAAYDALGDHRGAVVAIDPRTGAILALVSKPSFDPNTLAVHSSSEFFAAYKKLNDSTSAPLVNRAIAGDLYHPGSVFKLVVASAAIDSGRFTPQSAFPNPASLQLPLSTSRIGNSGGGTCGPGAKATIATALRLSCNIPFAQLGSSLGESTIADYATRFGFGEPLAIPMPVTPSIFPRGLDAPSLMLSSFGQGDDRVTPMQMAMVSAAIGNGGIEMQPNLVEKIIAPDLTELKSFTPLVFSTPITSSTAKQLTEMMIANVRNGAASNATIFGVDVAGKTGTAENGPGDPHTLWFTGFAPANNPRVAVAVVVEGGGAYDFGNTVAAPIAKKVIEAVLNK